MTQMHADGKQGMDVRARRFQNRIRMSVLSKIKAIGENFFIAKKRRPKNAIPKNRCLFRQNGFLQAAIWTEMISNNGAKTMPASHADEDALPVKAVKADPQQAEYQQRKGE